MAFDINDDDFFAYTGDRSIQSNRSATMKYALMMCIYEAIQEEFQNNEVSGNLRNTMVLTEVPSILGKIGDGDVNLYGESDYCLEIVAMCYDLEIYKETHQIVYNNYATSNKDKKREKIIKAFKEGKSYNEIESEIISKVGQNKYYSVGSYADEVDKSGGFSHKHTDYVENCIRRAINKWKKMFPELDISSNL